MLKIFKKQKCLIMRIAKYYKEIKLILEKNLN